MRPQIFEKSRRHLQILGARMVTWSKFHTKDHSSGVTHELHCYLALSSQCMWADTHFYMQGLSKLCRKKGHHHTEVNHLGNQSLGICAHLPLIARTVYKILQFVAKLLSNKKWKFVTRHLAGFRMWLYACAVWGYRCVAGTVESKYLTCSSLLHIHIF